MLGGKLVNRTASSVTLTELGAAILPPGGVLSVAQLAFHDMEQIVAAGDGTVRIGLVPSVSSAALSASAAGAGANLSPSAGRGFTIRPMMRWCVSCKAGRLISVSVPSTARYPPRYRSARLREDPFVAVLHGDDPLADQPHLPWKLLAGRDIAVFSKGNIQRLVGALAEAIA